MGYTFSNRRTIIDRMVKLKKNKAADLALRTLRAFLDENEPQLVYFLVNMWRHQGKAITYKELREAILFGDLTMEHLEQWQQDYSRFVTEYMLPTWTGAMEAAAEEISRKYPDWRFDPYGYGVKQWTESRSAAFVTEVTETQFLGLQSLVRRAANLEDMSVDVLARAIRPMVGLNRPQAIANMRYFENLIANGIKEKKAHELSIRYAARQHRYRGYMIARTELAFAYNQGSYEGTRQAQEAGYMGEVVKIWSTAYDERVCPICRDLDGQRVPMDGDFSFTTRLAKDNPTIKKVPPAHPNCRCAVMYEEISPPIPRYSIPTDNPQ